MFSLEKVKALNKCMKQIQQVYHLNGFLETLTVDYKLTETRNLYRLHATLVNNSH